MVTAIQHPRNDVVNVAGAEAQVGVAVNPGYEG